MANATTRLFGPPQTIDAGEVEANKVPPPAGYVRELKDEPRRPPRRAEGVPLEA